MVENTTVHPANAGGFEWDDGNERELAAHGIAPWEVEEVFLNGSAWGRNKKAGSGDWKMDRWTDGGRALAIVVRVIAANETLRAIIGWSPDAEEIARYLRRRN